MQELKGKKIGVTGSLGATNHVSLVIALEKLGMSPKDFNILALPPHRDAALARKRFSRRRLAQSADVVLAQKKGFPNILDIGSLVEMPGGGLTVMMPKTSRPNPMKLKRVIWAMQSAKDDACASPRTKPSS